MTKRVLPSWVVALLAMGSILDQVSVVSGQSCCASDGTIAINGASSASFDLGNDAGTDATIQVFTMDPTIIDGASITCTYTCTSSSADVTAVNIKFGSLPTSASDFNVKTESASNCAGTTAERTVTGTQSSGTTQTGYVFLWSGGATTSGFVVSCTSPISGSPTASPVTPAPSAAPTCECFSESATVQVQPPSAAPIMVPPKPVAMKDLEVGQKVFAGWSHPQDGSKPNTNNTAGVENLPIYETVYGFGHRNEDKHDEYLRITTTTHNDNQQPLELSASHLIYLHGQEHPVRSDSLRVGDQLIHVTEDGTTKIPAAITHIEWVVRKGLYQPLTQDGTIVVDGIETSTYVSMQGATPRTVEIGLSLYGFASEHDAFHWCIAPYRFFCTKVAPHLCVNANYFYNNDSSNGDDSDDGILYFLYFGKSAMKHGEESLPLLLKIVLDVLLLSFCGIFVFLDNVAEGDAWSIIAAAVLGLSYYSRCYRKRTSSSQPTNTPPLRGRKTKFE